MSNEQSPVTGYPAGLGRRLGALLYDFILVFALWVITILGLVIAKGEAVFGPVVNTLLLAEWIGFYVYAWTRGGQTLGMTSWRIRLVTPAGEQPALTAILIRIVVAPVSLICAGLGYLWMYLDKEQLTWHDRVSDTRVVHIPKNRG